MEIDHLIQAIIEEPDEDNWRLVLADYLEERGDARAEIIRLQLELKQLTPWDSSRRKIRSRELALMRKHGGFGSVPPKVRVLAMHGGFIDEIEVTITRFLKLQDEIFAHSPVRGVKLIGTSKRFLKLCESPHLPRLRQLKLKRNEISEQDMSVFLTMADLTNLRELSITDWESENGWTNAVANSTVLGNLRSLDLRGEHIDSQSAMLIVENAELPHLESLALGDNISDDAIRGMVKADNLANLKRLSVRGGISEYAAKGIHNGVYQQLEELHVDTIFYRGVADTPMSDCLIQPLPNLKHLSVTGDYPDSLLVEICGQYQSLETLDMGWNRITDHGIASLARSPLLKSLEKLVLTHNGITMAGVESLVQSEFWNSKTRLYVRSNNLSRANAVNLRNRFGKTFGNLGPESEMHY